MTEERQAAARRFYTTGELVPLVEFIERRLLPVFDNRDLRWSNELTLKTAFLTTLFNDTAYIMDSETAIDTCPERSRREGYGDLSLMVRPDMRQYQLLDHLMEFKYIALKDLSGMDAAGLAQAPREELRDIPLVRQKLAEAEAQLTRYRESLERAYGGELRLHTHALVGIGMTRLVW